MGNPHHTKKQHKKLHYMYFMLGGNSGIIVIYVALIDINVTESYKISILRK